MNAGVAFADLPTDENSESVITESKQLKTNNLDLEDLDGDGSTIDGLGNIVVDVTGPTSELTSVSYNAGVLTFTGTGLTATQLGRSDLSNIADLINWSDLKWDINDDDDVTADFTFDADYIETAEVTSQTTMVVTMTDAGRDALFETAGFGAAGGADDIIVTEGFLSDVAGNVSETAVLDTSDGQAVAFSQDAAPELVSITSSPSTGSLGVGTPVEVTLTFDRFLAPGGEMTVTFNTGETVALSDPGVFKTAAIGDVPTKTVVGTYTISEDAQDTDDLSVSSYTAGTIESLYGTALSVSSIPDDANLDASSSIEIDVQPPTVIFDDGEGETGSLSYNSSTGTLTLSAVSGLNASQIGAALNTDIASLLNWEKLSWDINGDDAETANFAFVSESDYSGIVASATLTDGRLTILLTEDGKAALEATTGFGEQGGSDTIDIAVGFMKDISGNISVTDAADDLEISYSDSTRPEILSIDTNEETSPDGRYNGEGSDSVDIVMTLSESVQANSSLDITLGTGDTVTLTTATVSDTLSGTLEISADSTSNTNDLNVNSVSNVDVADLYGNDLVAGLPDGENLADNAAIVIDTIDPKTTITKAVFAPSSNTLKLTGTKFDGLGVPSSSYGQVLTSDTYLDMFTWSKLTWEIDGEAIEIAKTDVDGVRINTATSFDIILNADFVSGLKSDYSAGFAGLGSADTITIEAGFVHDIAGNAGTLDALSEQTLTYNDTSGPTALSISAADTPAGSVNGDDYFSVELELSENVAAGSEVNITFNTGNTVSLTTTTNSSTLTGLYEVPDTANQPSLQVQSLEIVDVVDFYGNVMSSTNISGGNIVQATEVSGSTQIKVDTIPVFFDLSQSNVVDASTGASDQINAGDTLTMYFTESVNDDTLVITGADDVIFGGTKEVSGSTVTFTFTDEDVALANDYELTITVSDEADNQTTLTYTVDI